MEEDDSFDFDAFLREHANFDLPPIPAYGKDDYDEDAEDHNDDPETEDGFMFEESLATETGSLATATNNTADNTADDVIYSIYQPKNAAKKADDTSYKPNDAPHESNKSTYRPSNAAYNRNISTYQQTNAAYNPNFTTYPAPETTNYPSDKTHQPSHPSYNPKTTTYHQTNGAYDPNTTTYPAPHATYNPSDKGHKQSNTSYEPSDTAEKASITTNEPANATGVKNTNQATHPLSEISTKAEQKPIQPDGTSNIIQVAHSTNYHDYRAELNHVIAITVAQAHQGIVPKAALPGDYAPVPPTIHADAHIVRPAALLTGHSNMSHAQLNIFTSVQGHQDRTSAAIPAAKLNAPASKAPLLEPLDHGVLCQRCNQKSIWQPGTAFCFGCMSAPPSERLQQEIIARQMRGIWSCTQCFHEADNGAGKHCHSCHQRQVEKNNRARLRREAGVTWVPRYVQNGGVQKPKSNRPKRSSKASRNAKTEAIKKGLNRK